MAELQLEKMTALGESTIFGVQESRGTKAKREMSRYEPSGLGLGEETNERTLEITRSRLKVQIYSKL
jgi:hypothetical protein